MSDAPETIWTCTHVGEYGYFFPDAVEAEGEYGGVGVEYRRTDLPATNEQAFANEKVKALAEVAKRIVGGKTFGVAHPNHADLAAALAGMEATDE